MASRLQGFILCELATNEANRFYTHLGIDGTDSAAEFMDVDSDHIIALFGAKMLASTNFMTPRSSRTTSRRSMRPETS